MWKVVASAVALNVLVLGSAYATQVSAEEEREFPLAIVFALIAVACGIGTALMAASQKKKD